MSMLKTTCTDIWIQICNTELNLQWGFFTVVSRHFMKMQVSELNKRQHQDNSGRAAKAQCSTLSTFDLGLVAPMPTSLDKSVFTVAMGSLSKNRQAQSPWLPTASIPQEEGISELFAGQNTKLYFKTATKDKNNSPSINLRSWRSSGSA